MTFNFFKFFFLDSALRTPHSAFSEQPIGWGFCDIRNNQGRDWLHLPRPWLPDITKTSSNYCFIIHCFIENIQKLLCEMQYKSKLTKQPHHSKPFNCSNHSKPFRCSFVGENLVGVGKFCIVYNVETLDCFSVNWVRISIFLGFPLSKKNHLFSRVHIKWLQDYCQISLPLGSSTFFSNKKSFQICFATLVLRFVFSASLSSKKVSRYLSLKTTKKETLYLLFALCKAVTCQLNFRAL